LAPGIVVDLNKIKILVVTMRKKAKIIRNGNWKEFNKHAVLIAEGFYLNSKKHGTWREYYDANGSIMIEENYQHGIQHGSYTSFYPNCQVCSKGQFSNGLREGFFKIYDEQGNTINNLLFVNNVEIENSGERSPVDKRTE
jgi:antitoxin component YwqK of YwqJK toxin-antitoxin module